MEKLEFDRKEVLELVKSTNWLKSYDEIINPKYDWLVNKELKQFKGLPITDEIKKAVDELISKAKLEMPDEDYDGDEEDEELTIHDFLSKDNGEGRRPITDTIAEYLADLHIQKKCMKHFIKQAEDAISEAERFANKGGLTFSWNLAYGMGGFYNGVKGEWISSSSSC